ncbi:hypothetical protein D8B26_007965 [Coccidioides posadasii str. Silveira]|uniref:Uncharacterized protein n=2 Tax=Coccidioides TaxID=5500 RepID=E9D1V7_COCPS|nr:conserved hypothetical protein [Coccidioides posadasii str. Silveira]KMU75741.1 hypothetical protein CISG_04915 [Coccidioides immitis RMSCC 3703]QVM13354.1 hypothetical protein D8B26_007965 [Coccidioides posadasii str. Silveira]TPX26425.1 hypothetical protein DIZ76_011887 [Coccidioides immitis]
MEHKFYSRFPGFQPNPSASAIDEFARLARHMNWNLRSKVYRTEWARFSALEFAKHYGVETSSLEKWQSLCRELDISKPTESITKCKKALASVHVNIFDLIDSRRTGAPIPKFTNVRALRRYTKQSGKIFPREAAKQDGFLSALLREIF